MNKMLYEEPKLLNLWNCPSRVEANCTTTGSYDLICDSGSNAGCQAGSNVGDTSPADNCTTGTGVNNANS